MRKIMKTLEKNRGFTIVELLTVMSIIIILISLLVPAMNKARIFAKEVMQKNQFKAIGTAVEMYRNEFEEYPESSYDDSTTVPGTTFAYCGAMKLAEAVLGQDLVGFHPYSRFRSDYLDGQGNVLYDTDPTDGTLPNDYNLELREGPYLDVGSANAHRLWNVYGGPGSDTSPPQNLGGFSSMAFVILDVYTRVDNFSAAGKSYIGMPVLYYRANTNGIGHPHFVNDDPMQGPAPIPPLNPSTASSLYYNYQDNDMLVQMGMPWNPAGLPHQMDSRGLNTGKNPPLDQSSAYFFYHDTYDKNVPLATGRPHNPDSFILLSAGYDGEYGTSDDITNFPQ